MLVDKDNKIIDEIQGRKYNVMVYWSERVKEPLLLELNEGGHTYSNDLFNKYFIIKKGKDGLYFERLHNSTKEIMELAISKYGQIVDVVDSCSCLDYARILYRLEQLSRSILEIVPTRQGQKAVVTKGEKKGPDLPQVKDHRLTEPVPVPKSTSITPPHVVQLSQGKGSESTVDHDTSKGAPPPVQKETPIKRTEITATSDEKATRQEIPYDPRSTRSDTIPGTSIFSNVSGSDSTRGGKTLLNGPESHLIVEDTGHPGAEEQETISRVDTTHGHPSGSTVLDTGVHNGTTEEMPTIESNIEDHRGSDHTRISGDGDFHSNTHLQDETSQESLTDNGHSAYQASHQAASPNRKDDESSGSASPALIAGIVVSIIVIKGVIIGLLLAKFPYIIYPSIKALL
ncbi:hypothetical protein MACJ_003108 [Theileria orientalis]|uniref:Uncharacterized protein n=1 Tax=Theileria orientalis TaxID=68886 RepID=A0A976M8U7_THEOR|nr:hypothetical protein MACJ_003108 [Theileria orientalis]